MFTASENGVLAYGRGANAAAPRLTWLDRSGKPLSALDSPGFILDINLSADQKRVVLDIVNFEVGGRELWQVELPRGVPSRLSLGDKLEMSPVWSPDGTRIVFGSGNKTNGTRIAFGPGAMGVATDLCEKPSSGVGKEETLFQSAAAKLPVDWSADGRFLLFESRDPGAKQKLWVLPLSEGKPFPLLQTPFSETLGAFSPDGHRIAYVSDESGRPEVYVQTFPISTAKWRISTAGGTQPRWRHDGKEIFYVAPDSKLMAVSVSAGAPFEAGIPAALFEVGAPPGTGVRHQYCVTPDGERFLVLRGTESQETPPITVVLNWTADVRK